MHNCSFFSQQFFFIHRIWYITTACFDWSTYARVVFAWDENTLQMLGRPSVFISMKSLYTILPKSNNDVVGLHFFIFLFLYDLMIQANFIVNNVIKCSISLRFEERNWYHGNRLWETKTSCLSSYHVWFFGCVIDHCIYLIFF